MEDLFIKKQLFYGYVCPFGRSAAVHVFPEKILGKHCNFPKQLVFSRRYYRVRLFPPNLTIMS